MDPTGRRAFLAGLLSCASLPALAGSKADPSQRPTEYDPSHEVSLAGTIETLTRHQPQGGPAVHIVIATADGKTAEIHVAPQYYLNWHQLSFRRGDHVEVVASKLRNHDHYLARIVRKGSQTVELRDAQGKPLWTHGTDH